MPLVLLILAEVTVEVAGADTEVVVVAAVATGIVIATVVVIVAAGVVVIVVVMIVAGELPFPLVSLFVFSHTMCISTLKVSRRRRS